ncbi:MAG: DUF3080 family protein [Pseudomonadales bacterium]|nr:DUF3080 family protein [Pseudomonadales bacterium]
MQGLAVGLALAALTACARTDGAADQADYLARLARVLDTDVGAVPEPAGPAYPPRRALVHELPRDAIDVGEFIDLHGCDMGALVGYRNSPLGRLQGASQRLGYEVAWLAALDRCGSAAPDWMRARARAKTAQLPVLYWNALFAGDEIRIALGASRPLPPGDFAWLLREFADHLDALERGGFDGAGFEASLALLRAGSWVGPARQDWAGWRAVLDAAADALDREAGRVCRNGRPTPRSAILGNVFAQVYLGQLQPRLADDLSRHEAWVAAFAVLADRLDEVATTGFREWYGQVLDPAAEGPGVRSEWRRTRGAVVRHAEAWQRLFATCGIDPRAVVRQD